MKVLVVGATGRAGRRLVAEALSRGHEVTALVRREGSAPEGTTEVVGDATDSGAIETGSTGADAVLIALGGNPAQGFDILSVGARAVIDAMHATGARRAVMVSQSSILDAPGGGYRGKNLPEEYKPIFLQHLEAYELFRDSDVDWSLFCPPNLPDGDFTGDYLMAIEAFPDDPSRQAVTGDVAHAMLESLDDERTFQKRVGIVTRGSE